LDFTAFRGEGTFYLRAEGLQPSYPFRIGAAPYGEVQSALLKSFYFQRCGVELLEAHAGEWKHDACHMAHGRVYGTDEMRPSAGGWHDAGDYGKYVVPAAKAVVDLLLAYELYPEAWHAPIGIPESGNGVPDVLNEARFELEWLFLMQREDGAAFHKLTTHRFPPLNTMPEADTAELVFSPVSYAATGTFAAAMATASRAYRPFDAAFAERCLAAAEQAWSWLATAEAIGFRNPPDVTTGEYGDDTLADERYWAAAALFRATERRELLRDALATLERGGFSLTALGWADIGGYGTIDLLLAGEERIGRDAYDRLLAVWTEEARRLSSVAAADAFGVSLLPEDYIWGSNMDVMNRAMLLLLAARWTGRAEFEERATRHWDYLLGCNATGYCYVTGFGGRPVRHPHHRPSVGDGVERAVPGMVAGGPNRGLQDDAAKEHLAGHAPALCFVDHEDSYSTNEMTIYWNSPAAFVAAHLAVAGRG
jgi:endoglucanase